MRALREVMRMYDAIAFRLGVSVAEVESALAGALSKLTEGLDEP